MGPQPIPHRRSAVDKPAADSCKGKAFDLCEKPRLRGHKESRNGSSESCLRTAAGRCGCYRCRQQASSQAVYRQR